MTTCQDSRHIDRQTAASEKPALTILLGSKSSNSSRFEIRSRLEANVPDFLLEVFAMRRNHSPCVFTNVSTSPVNLPYDVLVGL